MIFPKHISVYLILTLTLMFSASSQNSQVIFGKNRIQNKNFKWEYLSTNSFDIYFYYGGRESAIYAAKYAETDYKKLCRFLGLSTYRNVRLLVYNTPKDLLMSNLGFEEPEPALGGIANFVKSKAEVCFQGDHHKFRNEIKKEVARYLINESLYGGNIKDILKNTYLLSIPEWYISGLAYYSGYGYTEEMDNHVRSLAKTGKLKHPNVLTGKDAEMYGASIWNYIALKYGESNVANVLQITQDTRSPKDAIGMVLGISYRDFIKNWKEYYLNMSFELEEHYDSPDKKLRISKRRKKAVTYTNVKISTTGEYVTFTSNYRGKYKVYVCDLRSKKRKVIYKGGHRVFDQTPDETMPLVSLFADKIAIVDFIKNKFWLSTFDKRGRIDQKINLPEFENILGFDFSDDGSAVIISGQMNGESDLWYYNFKENAYRQLSLDFQDDLTPNFLSNTNKAFVFSSNRKVDTLINTRVYADRVKIKDYYENLDLFVYENTKGVSKLKRLTNTIDNEYQPAAFDDSTITYTAEYNGIRQLYTLDLNTGVSERITAFLNSVKCYDLLPKTTYGTYVVMNKNKEEVYFDPNFTLKPNPNPIINSTRKNLIDAKYLEIKTDEDYQKYLKDSLANLVDIDDLSFGDPEEVIDTDNYTFDSEKDSTIVSSSTTKNKLPEDQIKIEEPRPYKRELSIISMSNALIMDNLRGFGTTQGATLLDMLGNHKLQGNFTFFLDFRSSDMSFEYQYLKRRIDMSLKVVKNRYFIMDNDKQIYHKYGINSIQTKFSYPFTPSSRISIAPHFTNQYFYQLSPPPIIGSTTNTDVKNYYVGATAELNIDNTEIVGANMRKGLRMRLLYEDFTGINKGAKSYSRIDLDVRSYIPIVNHLTFAFRGSGGKFLGRGVKYFMMGGSDGLVNRGNSNYSGENNPFGQTLDPYAGNPDILLNKFVTNVRGYGFNTVYGQNYFLLNAELRLPITKFFLARSSVGSSFVRHLQVYGFGDLGAAWTGSDPFSRNNTFSQTNYYSPPFYGKVITYSTPVLSSYGFGFRSFLLGYYLKLDIAYPVRDFTPLPRAYVISIGHDF